MHLDKRVQATSESEPQHHHKDHHHYNHRPARMTTTIHDNDHGDQDDNEQDDSTRHPHQSHLGTENSELPTAFHMVAEHRLPADHHPSQEGAMTIDPSSPTTLIIGVLSITVLHLIPSSPTSGTSRSSWTSRWYVDISIEFIWRRTTWTIRWSAWSSLWQPSRAHQQLSVASSAHQVAQPSGSASSSGAASSGMPLTSIARQTSTALAIRPIGAPLSPPTTKSRGRASQGSSSVCSGHPSLSLTSDSSMTTTPLAAPTAADPAHHEPYLQHEEEHQLQPMEIDSSLPTGRSSSSSFISWQDSSVMEHHLARFPGFWSQDGYQGFWGHPPPMPIQHRRDHPYGDRPDQHWQQQPREDRHQSSNQQSYQRPTLEAIREEHAPLHHREREQQHHSDRVWHRRDHQACLVLSSTTTSTTKSGPSISTSHRSRTRMGQLHLTEATTSTITREAIITYLCINLGKAARWRTSNQGSSQHLPPGGILACCNLVVFVNQDECHHSSRRPCGSSRSYSRHPLPDHRLHSQHQPTSSWTQITSCSSSPRSTTRSCPSISEQQQSCYASPWPATIT